MYKIMYKINNVYIYIFKYIYYFNVIVNTSGWECF